MTGWNIGAVTVVSGPPGDRDGESPFGDWHGPQLRQAWGCITWERAAQGVDCVSRAVAQRRTPCQPVGDLTTFDNFLPGLGNV